MTQNSFQTQDTLAVQGKKYTYFSLSKAEEAGLSVKHLPLTLKTLLENLLRCEDGVSVTCKDIEAISAWLKQKKSDHEIAFRPTRVLMQDFTGVPAVVDLAAMRDAMKNLGGDPEKINPLSPVDLVIDHSVQVDSFGRASSFGINVETEMERNRERYEFLRWGQKAFNNFRVVPPGTGICHQVNLEYLGKTVWLDKNQNVLFPDTVVGTDSHTTMINGLGVLGWGVGGIEAEAAMLGQPISMLIPEVVGFKFTGKLGEGITATDLVLTVTEKLRAKGVVSKFVEFFGEGLADLTLPDRATIANMAPEYGATCGFFPVDEETLSYMRLTGRDEETIAIVEAYSKAQGLWRNDAIEPEFTEILTLDLSTVKPSLAGPKRPQDRVELDQVSKVVKKTIEESGKSFSTSPTSVANENYHLQHGDIVIAAITSCTNTSNPQVLMAAGLLAKKAIEKGLVRKPWVKTSLAPGSKVVTEYLQKAGLQTYLNQLGFDLVGYGCTTCIGNSGPLPEHVSAAITKEDLSVCAVLSGNRNFEGRIHPEVKLNWLASPPLVVAYALSGTMRLDLARDPIGEDKNGKAVFLKDIWPSNHEIANAILSVNSAMFQREYAEVFKGDDAWRALAVTDSETYAWNPDSTYVKNPPFFEGMTKAVKPLQDIVNANILAIFADSVTTDHISPAGSIKKDSPAGKYLLEHGVAYADFNSYGARRGNHEVMMRGTFANIRIRNEMLSGIEGGMTRYIPNGETLPIYDAAMKYIAEKIPTVVIAGKEYGTGSSRDWAAKGPKLLGVKAVIAESFERIHRTNLIGMGILPLQFRPNENRKTFVFKGDEVVSIAGLNQVTPGKTVSVNIVYSDGSQKTLQALCRIDTQNELEYFRNGGILPFVIRQKI